MSAGRHRAASAGAASLTVILLLLFAAALTAGAATRTLLVEQRAARQQLHNALAFEAAEAGLEWTVARLNSGAPLAADCSAAAAPGDGSFRDRLLAYDSSTGRHSVRLRAGTVPSPGCLTAAAGWRCDCSGAGPTEPGVDEGSPMFRVELAALPGGGLQLRATGCSNWGAPCAPAARAGAASRVQVALVLAGGLRSRPAAALTVGGDVSTGTAAPGFHNPDALAAGTPSRQAGGSTRLPHA